MTGSATQRRMGTLFALALLAVPAACAQPSAAARPGSVSYERHGGIAGENTRLTVTPSGIATLDSRAGARRAAWTRQLSAVEWRALRSSLDAARFDTLNSRYGPPGTCNDCFVDTVRYGGRTVTVEGEAAPGRLAEALRLLSGVAARD